VRSTSLFGGHDHRSSVDTQRLRLSARVAATLAVIYAIPHIWWGLGVDWLAPGDMSGDSGLGSNDAIRFFAFYGMGFLAVVSAYLTIAMVRPVRPAVPPWLITLHGWCISVLLLLRGGIGVVESTLISTGVRDCPFVGCGGSEPGRDSIGMTGMFWEPLFVVWGVALLATVAWKTRSRQRR